MNHGAPPDEFALIETLFEPLTRGAPGAFRLKDDAAVLAPRPGHELVASTDMLAAGVHFRPEDPPALIARKALRVNLSDLAAMGAEPYGYLLGLAWPREKPLSAIAALADGLARDGALYDISLLGGDTIVTSGPLTVSVTAFGEAPQGECLQRAGARNGDELYVSGTLGDAAAGLGVLQGRLSFRSSGHEAYVVERYHTPEPRLRLGQALRGLATAAVDVSDGLLADLGHLCTASGVGATVWRDRMPLSDALAARVRETPDEWALVLGGGDDYELLFTAPAGSETAILAAAAAAVTPVTRIGVMEGQGGVRLVDANHRPIPAPAAGYRHF